MLWNKTDMIFFGVSWLPPTFPLGHMRLYVWVWAHQWLVYRLWCCWPWGCSDYRHANVGQRWEIDLSIEILIYPGDILKLVSKDLPLGDLLRRMAMRVFCHPTTQQIFLATVYVFFSPHESLGRRGVKARSFYVFKRASACVSRRL